MDFELWWLIAIPLFFGLGWLAARVDIKELVSESRALPRSYFKGLNFLLTEQPDKAIEAFIEVVKVDSETVELHFALGSLFRRRGETERAIRMHQNLIQRPNLSAEQALNAVFELGQDYLKAGLLDRAEEVFQRLRDGPYASNALQFLLEIFQQEKEWQKAIDIAAQLPRESASLRVKQVAQFHCELAQSAIAQGAHDTALIQLDLASAVNRRCVRAYLMRGDVHASAGRDGQAIEEWKRVEQQDPNYLALAAPRLLASYHRLGDTQVGVGHLRSYLERYPSLDLLDVTFQACLEQDGAEAAYRLVRDELRRNPTLLGLDKLLEAQILVAPAERRTDLELVKNLVHSQTRRLARYRCTQCGFKARQFYWHCPGCGGWETYPPRRSEEFDLTP